MNWLPERASSGSRRRDRKPIPGKAAGEALILHFSRERLSERGEGSFPVPQGIRSTKAPHQAVRDPNGQRMTHNTTNLTCRREAEEAIADEACPRPAIAGRIAIGHGRSISVRDDRVCAAQDAPAMRTSSGRGRPERSRMGGRVGR